MKRFLPLLILTGFLFGQDMLLHKSGENYKGTFIGKVDEDIVFQVEGENVYNKFPINDVDIVITSRGGIKVELYYPFDIPTNGNDEWLKQYTNKKYITMILGGLIAIVAGDRILDKDQTEMAGIILVSGGLGVAIYGILNLGKNLYEYRVVDGISEDYNKILITRIKKSSE